MHTFFRPYARVVSIGAPYRAQRRPLLTVLAAGVALSFAVGAMLVASVISAAPASAHAVLAKITPSAGAQLTTAPTQVVLEFNESVSASFANLVVTNAAGVSVAQGKPTVVGAKVTQALGPDLASGGYRVGYRVVGEDGHPMPGESRFTLILASDGSPPASAGPNPSDTSSPLAAGPQAEVSNAGQGGWLTRFLVPIAAGVGLLVIIAGVMLRKRPRG